MVDIPKLPKPTPEEAARFLGQASLGYTMDEVDELVRIGYDSWFTQQFSMPADVLPGHFDWLQAKWPGVRLGMGVNSLEYSVWRRFIEGKDVLRQKITLVLSEILVMSVSSVNGEAGHWPAYWGAGYLDLLQNNAFGTYRKLLEVVSTSPGQAIFLTFAGSKRSPLETDGSEVVGGRRPDENYARELLQLFSIGLQQLERDGTPQLDASGAALETYTNFEVTELAKLFTNWALDGSIWNMGSQDHFKKPLTNNASATGYDSRQVDLGLIDRAGLNAGPIPSSNEPLARLQQALDRIYAHPSLAPFVCKQLIKHMVTCNPSPNYIERVVDVFDPRPGVPNATQKGDMQAVLKAILMDESLFDAATGHRVGGLGDPTFGKLREPACRFVHLARAFGATSPSGKWAMTARGGSRPLDQTPMFAPSVFNFFRPGYVPPNSNMSRIGLVAPEFQMTTEPSVLNYVNFITSFLHFDSQQYGVDESGARSVVLSYNNWIAKASDPTELVNSLNLLFTANSLQDSTVQRITQAISAMPLNQSDPANLNLRRIKAAILLVMASPEYIVQK